MTDQAAAASEQARRWIDPIVASLHDPYASDRVLARIRQSRQELGSAPRELRPIIRRSLEILGEVCGRPTTYTDADSAYTAWRCARTPAERREVAHGIAACLAQREGGDRLVAPFFLGWGGEPRFAAEVMAAWPVHSHVLDQAAIEALGLLGFDFESWPWIAVARSLHPHDNGLREVPDPGVPEGSLLDEGRLEWISRRRERRRELAGILTQVGAPATDSPPGPVSVAPFAGWARDRQVTLLSAALIGLGPFATNPARVALVERALDSILPLLRDAESIPREHVASLARAAASAVSHLGSRLRLEVALETISAGLLAIDSVALVPLEYAVDLGLARDFVVGVLAAIPGPEALALLHEQVTRALSRNMVGAGPGLARALGALLATSSGQGAEPAAAWLASALRVQDASRVLATQALWELIDRTVVDVGLASVRSLSPSASPPLLGHVALATFDLLFPAAQLAVPLVLADPVRVHEAIRQRADQLATDPGARGAIRRTLLLWLEASAVAELRALETLAGALAPATFDRLPQEAKQELLAALQHLLQGDVLPPPRLELAGLESARAHYSAAPALQSDDTSLPTGATLGLDDARWQLYSRVLHTARGHPSLSAALLNLAYRQRPARSGDELGREERAERELAGLLALVRDAESYRARHGTHARVAPAVDPAADARDLALILTREDIHLIELLHVAIARIAGLYASQQRPFDPLPYVCRILAARPGALLPAWLAAISTHPELRARCTSASEYVYSVQVGEDVRLPFELPGATILGDLDRAYRDLAPESSTPTRAQLTELGERGSQLARALDAYVHHVLGGADPSLAGMHQAAALLRDSTRAYQATPLHALDHRRTLLRKSRDALSELARQAREGAPTPEHLRCPLRLENWANLIDLHRERFVEQVDRLLAAERYEELLDLEWDALDEVVQAVLQGLVPHQHERLAQFLREVGRRHPEALQAPRDEFLQRACESSLAGFVAARDLPGLLTLDWETPYKLVESATDAAPDHMTLAQFLAQLEARRGNAFSADRPEVVAARAAVRGGCVAKRDLRALGGLRDDLHVILAAACDAARDDQELRRFVERQGFELEGSDQLAVLRTQEIVREGLVARKNLRELSDLRWGDEYTLLDSACRAASDHKELRELVEALVNQLRSRGRVLAEGRPEVVRARELIREGYRSKRDYLGLFLAMRSPALRISDERERQDQDRSFFAEAWEALRDDPVELERLLACVGKPDPEGVGEEYPHFREGVKRLVDYHVHHGDLDGLADFMSRPTTPPGEPYRWSSKWTGWYRRITSPWWLLVLLLAPFVPAVLQEILRGQDVPPSWVELAGVTSALLFALYLGLMAVGGLWLTLVWGRRAGGSHHGGHPPPAPFHREALLPGLLALLVVPFVAMVELEHSYKFPLEVSGAMMLFIIFASSALSLFFLTTDYRAHDPETAFGRATKTFSVGVLQSFMLALVLSFVFAPTTIHGIENQLQTTHNQLKAAQPEPKAPEPAEAEERHPEAHAPAQGTAPNHHGGGHPSHEGDEIYGCPACIPHSYSPRRVEVQLPLLHLDLLFFPSLILTWTFLGILFGVVLETYARGHSVHRHGDGGH